MAKVLNKVLLRIDKMTLGDNSKKTIQKGVREIIAKHLYELNDLQAEEKSDTSPVTIIDREISDLVKNELCLSTSDVDYFSEEDFHVLSFPSLVVDPIDGTRGLVAGLPECAVSIAYLKNGDIDCEENWGWIFNPFTGLEVSSFDDVLISKNIISGSLLGMVSRTDWNRGQFTDFQADGIELSPRGSIASKLALLAVNACDFVWSKTDKNIWDIAAGTIILKSRGIELYQNGCKLKSLDKPKIEGPILWCDERIKEKITCHLK